MRSEKIVSGFRFLVKRLIFQSSNLRIFQSLPNRTSYIVNRTIPSRLTCTLIICTFAHMSYSQHAGYTKVTDVESFRKKFAAESIKINTISANFKQEKVLTALTETITSTGEFWFKRSNRVRIDYVKPFVYKVIMNQDKLLIKDDDKVNTINVKSNNLFQQVNRIILDCVQGSILENKDFTTLVFENDKMYLLEMTTVNKTLKSFFSTIVLIVDKKDISVSTLIMNEPGGDKTTMTFTNKKINSTVADAVFTL